MLIAIVFPFDVVQKRHNPNRSRPHCKHLLDRESRIYANEKFARLQLPQWPSERTHIPDDYAALKGSVVGVAKISHPFPRLDNVLQITNRDVDVSVSSWDGSLRHFLCELKIEQAGQIEPVLAIDDASLGAPKNDLFQLDDGFVSRLRSEHEIITLFETDGMKLKWALQVPAEMSLLIVRNQWKSVTFPIPPKDHQASALFSDHENPLPYIGFDDPQWVSENPLNAGALRNLMYLTGEFAQASGMLVPDNNDDEEDEDGGNRLRMQGYVMQLRRAVQYLQGNFSFKLGNTNQYEMVTLLQFFLLADLLRSTSNLLPTLHTSLGILFPPATANQFKEIIGAGSKSVPHASTISRARFVIDLAFMMWYQDFFQRAFQEGGLTAYVLSDCSPVAGREWQVGEIFFLENKNLLAAYEAAINLVTSANAIIAGLETDIDRQACAQSLNEMIHEHMLPLMGIGSRAADIVHKLITLVTMFQRVAGPWHIVFMLIQSVMALTTDWGTEFMFAILWDVLSGLDTSIVMEMFPGWRLRQMHDDNSDDEDALPSQNVDGMGCLRTLLTGRTTFEIPGTLHMFSFSKGFADPRQHPNSMSYHPHSHPSHSSPPTAPTLQHLYGLYQSKRKHRRPIIDITNTSSAHRRFKFYQRPFFYSWTR